MRAIASPIKTNIKLKATYAFNVRAFLDSAGVAKRTLDYRKSEKIYSQGDPASGVEYIQEGTVKLTVVNEVGKEAVVAILGPGDFLGEGCLAGQVSCMGRPPRLHPRQYYSLKKKR